MAALHTIESFLLDMDGTIYLGPKPLPGAAEFIAFLNQSGRKHLFFTNNPSSDAIAYSEKLRGMGIDTSPEQILTSGEATARFLVLHTPHRRVFAIGTPSFEAELQRHGLTLETNEPDVVVLSFDKTLTYAKLERACLLLREGLPYVATNPDKLCPTEYGYIPDCGAIAALLKEATGRDPKYIGKPNPEMIHMGLAKLNSSPESTAMVGDRLYTDMEMAYRAGATAILVLTGEATRQEVEQAPRKPDYVFDSVAALHKAIETP
ncbi:MAG: acid sugar phosphatase [Candidatus Hydrogenedentota bacterium]